MGYVQKQINKIDLSDLNFSVVLSDSSGNSTFNIGVEPAQAVRIIQILKENDV
jgi:hypothetical protein